MKQSILKKGLILLTVCTMSVGTLLNTYAACKQHSFNGSFDYKAPTCTTAGYRKAHCINCGKVLQNTKIPALGHKYVTYGYYKSYGVFVPVYEECERCGKWR